MERKDLKEIEVLLTKFRLLLNDVDLICFDIEQISLNDDSSIERRWEEIRRQTEENYRSLIERKSQRLFVDQLDHRLKTIEKQISETTTLMKISQILERLGQIEKEFFLSNSDECFRPLKGSSMNIEPSRNFRFLFQNDSTNFSDEF